MGSVWPNCICNFSFSFSVCNIYIHACFWLIFVLFFISFSAIPNCMDICYLSFRFVSCIHAFCWLVFFHLFFSVTPLFVYIDFWNIFSLSYLLPYVYYGLHFVWLKRYFLFVSFSPVSCLLYLFGFVYLVSIFIFALFICLSLFCLSLSGSHVSHALPTITCWWVSRNYFGTLQLCNF